MKEKNKHLSVLRTSLPAKFLIIALVAILIFDSCKESSVIGLDVQPESDLLNAAFKDTSTLISYTLLEDPFKTDETSLNLLGSYNDPVFGKASASIYTQVRLPNNITDVNFGAGLVFDSLVLTLPYSGYYGTLESQTVKVYELSDDLYKDSSYYSNRSLNHQSTELADITFKPMSDDKILRIRLSDQFGGNLLSQSTNLKDNTAFLKFFKGLYIAPANTAQAQGEGALLYFNLTDSLAKMTLYYRKTVTIKSISNPQKDSSYIDITHFAFEINSSSARFNHFEHDYSSSSAIVNQLKDPSLGQNLVYLQQMAGLKTKIKIPYLKNWVDSGPIAINKAEVVLKLDPQYISNNYSVPSKLSLVEIDSLGNSINLPDEKDSYFGGDYNSSTQEYRFNIARHIQSILDGKKKDYGFYLLPFVAESNLNAERLVLGGGGNTSYQMKLRLTYTKLY